MNVAELLREQAARSPDRPALIEGRGRRRRVLTFAELEARTANGAAFLRKENHQTGDRILFLQAVSIDLYTGLLAALRAGLTAMFADPGQGRAFLENCVEAHPPQALFGGGKARLARLVSPPLRSISRHYDSRDLARATAAVSLPHDEAIPGDVAALITFTSGSTGRPKGIVRTRDFLGAQHRALEKAIRLEPGEVDLVTLPMFVLANLASGVTSVLADTDLARPGEADARAVWAQAAENGVDRAAASPAFFESLLAGNRPFPDLKKIFTGGAPVSPQLLDALGSRLSGAAIVAAVYGSSEAEPIAVIDRNAVSGEDARRMREGAGLLAGEPVRDIRCQVIRDPMDGNGGTLEENEFRHLVCAPSEPGEIVVAGAHVLDGYLDAADDADRKLRVGDETWHRTGDAGYFDASGRLWLLGRCEAAFNDAGGNRRYPFEAENPANAMPGVRRSAALVHRGSPTLFVELEKGAQPSRELSEALLSRLPGGAISAVRFVDRIPVDRRHNAKIDYVALRNEVSSLE